jgi:hypothetical protein
MVSGLTKLKNTRRRAYMPEGYRKIVIEFYSRVWFNTLRLAAAQIINQIETMVLNQTV